MKSYAIITGTLATLLAVSPAFAGFLGYSELEIYNQKLVNATISCSAKVQLPSGNEKSVSFEMIRGYNGPGSMNISVDGAAAQTIGSNGFNFMSDESDYAVLNTNRAGDITIQSLEKASNRQEVFRGFFQHGGRNVDVWSLSIESFMSGNEVKKGTVELDASLLGGTEGSQVPVPVECLVK